MVEWICFDWIVRRIDVRMDVVGGWMYDISFAWGMFGWLIQCVDILSYEWVTKWVADKNDDFVCLSLASPKKQLHRCRAPSSEVGTKSSQILNNQRTIWSAAAAPPPPPPPPPQTKTKAATTKIPSTKSKSTKIVAVRDNPPPPPHPTAPPFFLFLFSVPRYCKPVYCARFVFKH